VLKKIALIVTSTACSTSASSWTMTGLFPPSSSVAGVTLSAAVRAVSLPTSVEPVKASLSTPSWAVSGSPASGP
jgi:hypothetical protein